MQVKELSEQARMSTHGVVQEKTEKEKKEIVCLFIKKGNYGGTRYNKNLGITKVFLNPVVVRCVTNTFCQSVGTLLNRGSTE